MLVACYKTKKLLKEHIGQRLTYQETSCFGGEYTHNGVLTVVGPGAYERKWYAEVTMKDHKIERVS